MLNNFSYCPDSGRCRCIVSTAVMFVFMFSGFRPSARGCPSRRRGALSEPILGFHTAISLTVLSIVLAPVLPSIWAFQGSRDSNSKIRCRQRGGLTDSNSFPRTRRVPSRSLMWSNSLLQLYSRFMSYSLKISEIRSRRRGVLLS